MVRHKHPLKGVYTRKLHTHTKHTHMHTYKSHTHTQNACTHTQTTHAHLTWLMARHTSGGFPLLRRCHQEALCAPCEEGFPKVSLSVAMTQFTDLLEPATQEKEVSVRPPPACAETALWWGCFQGHPHQWFCRCFDWISLLSGLSRKRLPGTPHVSPWMAVLV